MSGLQDPARYVQFLSAQLRAREPIEAWVALSLAGDMAPPAVSHLLRADLAELGSPPAGPDLRFAMPDKAEPIGLSWAIAGSHLGNRMMLAKLSGHGELPTRFLESAEMIAFWSRLRPHLDRELPEDVMRRAAQAAEAVFDLFLEAMLPTPRTLAA